MPALETVWFCVDFLMQPICNGRSWLASSYLNLPEKFILVVFIFNCGDWLRMLL